MTREELLKIASPIRMNTEDVRAILDGRKTITRRVLKTKKYIPTDAKFGYTGFTPPKYISCRGTFFDINGNKRYGENFIKMPYNKGDYLYVRETWSVDNHNWLYRADFSDTDLEKLKNIMQWGPSIHMLKKIARIFLRVTDVRVERLQNISTKDLVRDFDLDVALEAWGEEECRKNAMFVWNSTVKKSDLAKYGWDANPWVWKISFERIEVLD